MIGPVLAHVAPARGAPLGDLVPATIVAAVAIALVAAMAFGHRRGAFGALARISDKVEAASGVPGWAVIPSAVGGASLLCAAFGYYWDVSWHIDRGRDPGPFANPAHWFIIVGLAGIAFAGVMANQRLFDLLRKISGSKATASTVLFAWLSGNLFLGAQLAWNLRPFIGAPTLQVQFLRDDPLRGNFYEAVWRAFQHLFL